MEALTSDIRRQTLDWLWVSIEALSASREPWTVRERILVSLSAIKFDKGLILRSEFF